jgi:hypothetical protein
MDGAHPATPDGGAFELALQPAVTRATSHALESSETLVDSPPVVVKFLCVLAPVVFLVIGSSWDWRSPGLYMDAINPEYLARWVLTGDNSLRYVLPGNSLFGRFPLFTGSIYHGSTHLYFALPFFAIAGLDLGTWRIVNAAAAATIVLLVGVLVVRVAGSTTLGWVAASVSCVGLAADPAFILALRTQAYSTIFPTMLVMAALLVMTDWPRSRRPIVRLLLGGMLFGLAAFTYFIMWMFLPAIMWLLLRPGRAVSRVSRPKVAASFLGGAVFGYVPFVVGILLIVRTLGFSDAVDYLRNMSDTLHVGARATGLGDRLLNTVHQVRQTFEGDWVSLMILHRWAGQVGLVRFVVGAILVVAALVVSAPRRCASRLRDGLRAAVLLLVSFCVVAVAFGDRLQGHHFAALVPIWYLAIGFASAVLIEAVHATFPPVSHRGLVFGGGVLVGAVLAGLGLAGQSELHRGLDRTGGYGLMSDRITDLALELERDADGASVIAYDWGYAFAIQLLAGAETDVVGVAPTPAVVHTLACRTNRVVVVSALTTKLDAGQLAARSGTVLERVDVWRSPDGSPLFQTTWFRLDAAC